MYYQVQCPCSLSWETALQLLQLGCLLQELPKEWLQGLRLGTLGAFQKGSQPEKPGRVKEQQLLLLD